MPPKGWKKVDGVMVPPDGWDEICGECWPDGWPENSGDAECVHGHYSRDIPE